MWNPFRKRAPAITVHRQDSAAPTVRNDAWQSALSGVGMVGYDKRLAAGFIADQVDYQECQELWRGSDLGGRIIEVKPTEMIRPGWELRIDGDYPDAKEVEKRVTSYWEDLDLAGHLWLAMCYEAAYGGGGMLLGVNDLRSMADPLDIEKVATFDWIETFEPIELTVTQWQNDPNQKDFGKPLMYLLNPITPGGSKISGAQIHASRVIAFPGIKVSRRQVTMRAGWGDSKFTRVRRVLRDFDNAWDATGILIHDFAQAVYKIKGLSDIIAMDKDKELINRIKMMELARSVLRAVVIDGEIEEFSRQQTPVNGLGDLLDKWMFRLAAAADMPVSKLMGMAPAGLNATGQYDMESWNNQVDGDRRRKMVPAIERVVRVIFSVLDLEEPDSWTIECNPLHQPTDQEAAQARLTQAQADQIYIQNSVISPEEIRVSRFGGAKYSFGTQLDTTLDSLGAPLIPVTGQVIAPGTDPNMKVLPSGMSPDQPVYQTPTGPTDRSQQGNQEKSERTSRASPSSYVQQTNDSPSIIVDDAYYNDTIERRGDKWLVLSMEGARLGEYDTEEEAQDRLNQIEYFKKARAS